MDPLILIVALGAALGGFVQGLSGFAFSLVAMSVWAWFVDPKLASAMAVFGALTGQLITVVSVRRGFDFKSLLPFLVGGLAGIPAGVFVLPLLDVHMFKAVLGMILVVWCPFMLLARRLPPVTAGGRIADAVSGLLGGISGGLGGFSGAIPTLWLTLRRTEKDEQRSIIQNFNLAMLAVTMAMYVATSAVTLEMLPMFAVVAPAMLIPSLLGARLYLGISEAGFRNIVLGCLTASGIVLLMSSLPHLLGSG